MNEVIIYTRDDCGYCKRALQLLQNKKVKYHQIAIDNNPELREEMIAKSGWHTVPQIFIGGTAIGGCDELYELEQQGKLDAMLGVKK